MAAESLITTPPRTDNIGWRLFSGGESPDTIKADLFRDLRNGGLTKRNLVREVINRIQIKATLEDPTLLQEQQIIEGMVASGIDEEEINNTLHLEGFLLSARWHKYKEKFSALTTDEQGATQGIVDESIQALPEDPPSHLERLMILQDIVDESLVGIYKRRAQGPYSPSDLQSLQSLTELATMITSLHDRVWRELPEVLELSDQELISRLVDYEVEIGKLVDQSLIQEMRGAEMTQQTQQISEVDEMIVRSSSTLGEETGKVGVDALKDWVTPERIDAVMDGIILACKLAGVTSLRFEAVLGIMGAGKDTSSRAVQAAIARLKTENPEFYSQMPSDLKTFTENESGKAGYVKSGEDGFLLQNPEVPTEYTEMLGKVGEVVRIDSSQGKYVDNNVAFLLGGLVWRKRIIEQADDDTFLIRNNLIPRTEEQLRLLENLMQKLKDNGIDSNLNLMQFVLLEPEVVTRIEANRQDYSKAAKGIATQIKAWLDTNQGMKSQGLESLHNQREEIQGFINSLRLDRNTTPEMTDMIQEVENSLRRAFERLQKAQEAGEEIRDDAMPYRTLTRIRSDVSAISDFLKIESVKMISTQQSPEEMVAQYLALKTGDAFNDDPVYRRLVEYAQEEAYRLVHPNDVGKSEAHLAE